MFLLRSISLKWKQDVPERILLTWGWEIESPKGTMFVWAKIPEEFRSMGSVEFFKMLVREAKVAVSPGLGFGEYGDEHVRFALIENNKRINQAVRGN